MLNDFWIMLPIGYLDDVDFQQLPNETKWHYVALYLLAKKADAGGLLASYDKRLDAKGIAWRLNERLEDIEKSISLLLEHNFLTLDGPYLEITNYEKEQQSKVLGESAEKKREQNRLRVQKCRNKIKNLETENNKQKDKQNMETEKEIEKETETEGEHYNHYSNALQEPEIEDHESELPF
jgi:hypothetical protein